MPASGKSLSYRVLEILPGFLTWVTLLGAFLLSYSRPVWVAVYIILFDLYWILKAINTASHLLSSFFKLKLHNTYDWRKRLSLLTDMAAYKKYLHKLAAQSPVRRQKKDLELELERISGIDFSGRDMDYRTVHHLVILPTYKESLEVLDSSIRSVAQAHFPADQIIFVLATEGRDRERAQAQAAVLAQKYGQSFLRFKVTEHPDNLPGEIKAKGANLTFACRQTLPVLHELKISFDRVVVSAFDSDTAVSPNYFSYLTYAFLTAKDPYRTSYQPMPVYNNNIWDAPAIARVVAVANSFWQMVEASRPDRLVTFSSQALSLRALLDVDFWPTDVVSDDSQIFYRCWLKYHGDYRTTPLFTTVSLDAMLDRTYWSTLKGQYKQKRRWAWGVENFPYLATNALKDKLIPRWKKFIYIERELEGKYFWATASIMIAVLGWLPLILGGNNFGNAVLAFNLPWLTRTMMQVATVFLIFSVYINLVLLPKRPAKYSKFRTVNMILQWVFVPIVSTVFGSFPAIDAQTRLMLGRRLDFWVTPKARKGEIGGEARFLQSKKV